MKAIIGLAALAILVTGAPAQAQQTRRVMHEHPAVLVKRQQAQQGYDYAAQFYPHPAWLYLLAEPRPERPAVVAGRDAAKRPGAQEAPSSGQSAPVLARSR